MRIGLIFRIVVHLDIETAVVAFGIKLNEAAQTRGLAVNVTRYRFSVLNQLDILRTVVSNGHSGRLKLAAVNPIDARARYGKAVILLPEAHPIVGELLGANRQNRRQHQNNSRCFFQKPHRHTFKNLLKIVNRLWR